MYGYAAAFTGYIDALDAAFAGLEVSHLQAAHGIMAGGADQHGFLGDIHTGKTAGQVINLAEAFMDAFSIDAETAKTLKFQQIPAWDSVGHMGLVAQLEEKFGIMMEPDDIVDLNSYEKGNDPVRY